MMRQEQTVMDYKITLKEMRKIIKKMNDIEELYLAKEKAKILKIKMYEIFEI